MLSGFLSKIPVFALADTNAAGTTGSGGTNWQIFVIYGVLFVGIIVFFIFMNRKSKNQEKEVNEMRNSLCVGDEVTTTGGVVGRIVRVKEETVVVETSRDGTKITFLKSAIARVDTPAPGSRKEPEKPAEETPVKEDKKESKKKDKKSK